MINTQQFKQYLQQRKLRAVSIDSYMRDIEQFCDYLTHAGIYHISEITGHEIKRYCDYMMQKGLAAVSMQRKIASIKRLFEYLCESGQARCNPASGVLIRKRGAAKAKVLTDEQLSYLLSMPDTRSVGGIRDKAMFALINSTGIKVSELIALHMEDLRMPEKCVGISREGGAVQLQLDDEVCRCLGAYLAARDMLFPKDDRTLFLNVYGEPITRQGVWKTLKKYAEAAQMEGITLETIRRSFARRYLNSGNDIRSLCDILGHSDIAITRAYVKS